LNDPGGTATIRGVPESYLVAWSQDRCQSLKRGQERGLRVEDGRLKGFLGIQGHVLRLTPESAGLLEGIVAGP